MEIRPAWDQEILAFLTHDPMSVAPESSPGTSIFHKHHSCGRLFFIRVDSLGQNRISASATSLDAKVK